MSMTEYVEGTRLVNQYQPSAPRSTSATTAGTSTRHRRWATSDDRARRLRRRRAGALPRHVDRLGTTVAPAAPVLVAQHGRAHRRAEDGERVQAVQGADDRGAERDEGQHDLEHDEAEHDP